MLRSLLLLLACASLSAAEFRGMFVYPLTNSTEGPGLIEITNNVNLLVASKCNAYLANVTSTHGVALTNGSAWDDLTNIIRVARAQNIDTYLWYAPYLVKSSSPELTAHADWAQKSKSDVARTDAICLNNPDVRDWELGMITNLITRYPGLAGIHLEEPIYITISYCCCNYCTNYFAGFGIDPHNTDSATIATQKVAYVAAGNMLVSNIWQFAQTAHPGFKIQSGTPSYTADASERLGHAWWQWQTNGWATRFCPQIYYTNATTFLGLIPPIWAIEPTINLAPTIGVVWSGPVTNYVSSIRREIVGSRRLGCTGWNVFKNREIDTAVPNLSPVLAETYNLTLFNTLRIGP